MLNLFKIFHLLGWKIFLRLSVPHYTKNPFGFIPLELWFSGTTPVEAAMGNTRGTKAQNYDLLTNVIQAKLDNPARPKPNQQARKELCTGGGNEACGARAMADYRP